MRIERLDHPVPTVADIPATADFCARVQGSLYIRDPDRNLIEISVYEPGTTGEDN